MSYMRNYFSFIELVYRYKYYLYYHIGRIQKKKAKGNDRGPTRSKMAIDKRID